MVLPNNVLLARSRLSMLKRRLEKDDVLHSAYTKSVQDYIDKGFARRVTPEEAMDQAAWYIPHHAVINPNKLEKARVVFDRAVKHKDVSLNDNLLHGPDVVNSLISVFIRFRPDPVAVLADVKAMFHQVLVTECEQKYLRFLWWKNGDLSSQPQKYCITRHIFGATSFLRCASYEGSSNEFCPLMVPV